EAFARGASGARSRAIGISRRVVARANRRRARWLFQAPLSSVVRDRGRRSDRAVVNTMTEPPVPEVECEQQHPPLPPLDLHAALRVVDVLAAVEFYTKKLGFRLGFTWGEPPTIAGVNLGNVQMFLEKGTPSPKGCAVYFVVGSADDLYEFQRGNGVEIAEAP